MAARDDADPVTWGDLRMAVGAVVALQLNAVAYNETWYRGDKKGFKAAQEGLDEAVSKIEELFELSRLTAEHENADHV